MKNKDEKKDSFNLNTEIIFNQTIYTTLQIYYTKNQVLLLADLYKRK